MVASVQTKARFTAEAPRVMFEGDFLNVGGPSFDVAPDGRRFVMIKVSGQDSAPKQLNVVLNWFEELRRRAPTGKD